MGNYRPDDRNRDRSGGGRFDRRRFGDRDDARRQMYKTVCSQCGNECEVPFRPSGEKPVYCSRCFESKGGGSRNRDDRHAPQQGGGANYDSRFEALNTKLDKILYLLTPKANEPAVETVTSAKATVKPKPEKKSVKTVKRVAKKTASK